MGPIVLLSTVIHVLVILRGAKFFWYWENTRDDDRAIVISVLVMSVLFILAQGYTAATNPTYILDSSNALRIGFDAASGLIFLSVVRYADNACERRGGRG